MKLAWIIFTFSALNASMIGCAFPARITYENRQQALRLLDEGTAELRRGELMRARLSFELAGELDHQPAVLDGLGCVAFLEGDFTEAGRLFAEAYEYDPAYTEALAHLALVSEALGQVALAEEYYEKSLRQNPMDATARNNYAAFLFAGSGTSHREEARRQLFKADSLVKHEIIEHNLQLIRIE